jgi:hypothetical protein
VGCIVEHEGKILLCKRCGVLWTVRVKLAEHTTALPANQCASTPACVRAVCSRPPATHLSISKTHQVDVFHMPTTARPLLHLSCWLLHWQSCTCCSAAIAQNVATEAAALAHPNHHRNLACSPFEQVLLRQLCSCLELITTWCA